jgi:hypothetical protein
VFTRIFKRKLAESFPREFKTKTLGYLETNYPAKIKIINKEVSPYVPINETFVTMMKKSKRSLITERSNEKKRKTGG